LLLQEGSEAILYMVDLTVSSAGISLVEAFF
jgi:hypothetical protein